MKKEFLYVGFYFDTENRFILKIGTTNNLARRACEHSRNYKRAKNYTMPKDSKFEYLWHLPMSKYNTLRYEDLNRQQWIEQNFGEFVRNDRFDFGSSVPEEITIKIRKNYKINVDIQHSM